MLISNPRIPYSLVTINHCQNYRLLPCPTASKLLYLPISRTLNKIYPPPPNFTDQHRETLPVILNSPHLPKSYTINLKSTSYWDAPEKPSADNISDMTVERAGRNLEYWAGVMVSLGGQTFFRLTWCRLGLLRLSVVMPAHNGHNTTPLQSRFNWQSTDVNSAPSSRSQC